MIFLTEATQRFYPLTCSDHQARVPGGTGFPPPRRKIGAPRSYRGGVLILLGLVLVLLGSFLAIIGMLGAVGSSLQLKLLPGRSVTPLAALRSRLPKPGAKNATPRVVVRGMAAPGPGGRYEAPLSGGECVWFLATQTAADGDQRSTVDRFAAQPFVLTDPTGARVLVGPNCPGLEQIVPSTRETRTDPHPWFDEAPTVDAAVDVYEFLLTEGQDILASGELSAEPDGTLRLGGQVVLSAGGEDAAAGDPARRNLKRNLSTAAVGVMLISTGALVLGLNPPSAVEQDNLHRNSAAAPAAKSR